jgi:RHS repeat-associated protein
LADGGVFALTHDTKGNPRTATDPLGQTTSFLHGPDNALSRLTDAEGQELNFSHDPKGNVTARTSQDGTSLRYAHDARGVVVEMTNRRGDVVRLDRDADGRVTRITHADNSFVSYAYNPIGQLTTVHDVTGLTSLDYDANHRLSRITQPDGRFLDYTYDTAGRRTSMTDQTGYRLDYGYTTDGQLETVSAGVRVLVRYRYDAAGRLIRQELGNGVATDYQYDAAGLLVNLVTTGASGEVLASFDYQYNRRDQRIRMTSLDGVWDYTYDATGQLTAALFTSSDPGLPSRTLEYVHDKVGNRIEERINGNVVPYGVTDMNLYALAGSFFYTYDADGNLIAKSDGNQTWTHDYDDLNRLVRSSGPDGVVDFVYNGLGFLVKTITNGVERNHQVDPAGLGNLVAEYDATGNLVNRYVHGLGLIAKNSDFYSFDGNGNTSELTDPTGAILNVYAHEPFGKPLYALENTENDFRFAGQFGVRRVDDDLLFMRNRFYMPSLGRFLSEDPIGLAGGDVNLLRYVQNDPVNWVDPEGLYWFRQSWQKPGVVGRPGTIIEPHGKISEFIERYVPAGYTLGDMHDEFVEDTTSGGLPDWFVNKLTIFNFYKIALTVEILRSFGLLEQPTPSLHTTEQCH